jgi:hypothetical protein
MDRKGYLSGNSACEGFFGRLKNGKFHNHDQRGVTVEQFRPVFARYIE